jgi:hypothetical protein
MMNDMNQDWMEKMRRDYNPPPETPVDEMWSAIQSRLGSEVPDVIPISGSTAPNELLRSRRARLKWLGGVAVAAAILVMGIGIGRMSVVVTPDGRPVTAPSLDAAAQAAFRAATLRHLSRSEALLASVAGGGGMDADIEGWGRSLLLQTRLLKDSPAGDDEVFRRLLEDLELILVQVAQLEWEPGTPDSTHREELGLITDALQKQDLMMRLRSVLPVGEAQAGI